MQPPKPSVISLPAADVTIPRDRGSDGVITKQFPIRVPEVERNEFMVSVRASSLKRARKRILLMQPESFPWHDLALAICTLSIGSFLGALAADIKPDEWKYIFFYSLMPVVGSGSGISYFFLRKKPTVEIRQHIEELLIDVPDPDKT